MGIAAWNVMTSTGASTITKIRYRIVNDGLNSSSTSFNAGIGEIKTTKITNGNCCDNENNGIELIWKNRKGGIDVFMLYGEVRIQEENEFMLLEHSLGFRRWGGPNTEDLNDGSFGVNQFANTFNQGSSGIQKTNIKASTRKKVISQFMNVDTAKWVAQIATSPKVWIRDTTTSELVPAYITVEDVEIQSKKKIAQLEVTLYYANQIVTQK
jgi:hypothetical protein